jgi:thiamine pyrophosphokinase
MSEVRAIVLGNGQVGDKAALARRLADWGDALIVAADGGARLADALGLRVDALIGDQDSLDPSHLEALQASGAHLETHPVGKDETDLELALLYAVERGATHILIAGAWGGRLDMTLSNVLLLALPQLIGLEVRLIEGQQTAWLIRNEATIYGQPGDTLSLIPLGGDALGIRTQGLEYPLNDEPLHFGAARGLSNVLTAPIAHVRLREGTLLAVHTPGRA